ncbi:MAG: glycosyltransferase family 2 protein [Lachnospiraceae bacterium]|nr:glycosyltransferase family 2 protein [Lachnospiraceae bacterium]
MAKTTVVIPNYNGMKYLKDCLDSLKLCQPQDFKVVVSDDGSTDGSIELLRNEYQWVRLLTSEKNTGFAAAVNRGIKASETDYCLLLNNDTRVEPDFVAALQRAIEADEKIFSVSAKMVRMDDPDKIDGAGDYYCALGWAFACGTDKKASDYNKPREIFSACGGASIYRRDVLIDIGLFDEEHFAYLEDVDVGYRARIKGYINMYEPSAVCLHAGSGFSGSRYNEFKLNFSSRNNIYIICKNMPLLQQLINLPFLMAGFFLKFLFFTKKGFGFKYLKGLFRGLKLGYSRIGRVKKVRFSFKNLPSYIKIQLELWANIIRFFA